MIDESAPPPPGTHIPKCPKWLRNAAFPTLLILIAVLGVVHLLVRTSTYGAALSNDSLNYISAAESLTSGDGLLSPGGEIFSLWPPLFPLLLAFISLFGIDPVDAGRFVNIAAFGLIVLLVGFWLTRHVKSRLLVVGATVTVMVSFPLSDVSSWLLTDTLFILFTLLALMQLKSFLMTGHARMSLAWSAIFTSLATLTRWTGITVLLAAVLTIMTRRHLPTYARLKYTAVYGAVSLIPLAVVLARNQVVSGTLLGNRSSVASGQSLLHSLSQVGKVFYRWVFLPETPGWLTYPLSAMVGLVALTMAVYFIALRERASRSSLNLCSLGPVLPFAIFALIYLAAIVLVVPFAVSQSIDSRYLAPVYVALLLLTVFMLDRFLHSETWGRIVVLKRILISLMLIAWLAHVSNTTQWNLDATATALKTGYIDTSFNTAYWHDSETIAYLRVNYLSGLVYTNNAGRLYWLADMSPPILNVPREKTDNCLSWLQRSLERIDKDEQNRNFKTSETNIYIVWFDRDEFYKNWCKKSYLKLDSHIEQLADFSDGAIFEITRANAAINS